MMTDVEIRRLAVEDVAARVNQTPGDRGDICQGCRERASWAVARPPRVPVFRGGTGGDAEEGR
jgi:hypothetical protein